MALLTKKQFADLASVTTSYITQYIDRKKINTINDLIDDQDAKNILFLEKRFYKKALDSELQEQHTSTFNQNDFKEKLEDEYLWPINQDYDTTKEKELITFNSELSAANKVIPRMIVDSMANGSIIEICELFLKREIALRKQNNLTVEKVFDFYEAICRNKIKDVQQGINEIMKDLEENQ